MTSNNIKNFQLSLRFCGKASFEYFVSYFSFVYLFIHEKYTFLVDQKNHSNFILLSKMIFV